MKRLVLDFISLLFFATPLAWPQQAAQAAPLPHPLAQTVTGALLSPRSDLSQCLTVTLTVRQCLCYGSGSGYRGRKRTQCDSPGELCD